MPREMSRTPVIRRCTRTSTPIRRSLANGASDRASTESPIIHDSHFNESVQTTPGMANGDGEGFATPHRETAEDVGTRSCPICCCDLAPGGDALWTWPCSCHLDLHLNCAVQMRVREPRPRCPHCRMEWPGDVADRQLIEACESAGVPFIRNWQQVPAQAESEDLVMPDEPRDLVLLCCERYIAMNITAASRRMTWAPVQRFVSDSSGCRIHAGWLGNWVCNTCGRMFTQDDDSLRTLRTSHSCALEGNCRLCLDFSNESYTSHFGSSFFFSRSGCSG